MTFRVLPLIPLLATLAGACSFSAEADIPEVDVTQHGVVVPGVPIPEWAGDVSVTSSFTYSSSNTAWAKRMNSANLCPPGHRHRHRRRAQPGLRQVRTSDHGRRDQFRISNRDRQL